MHQVYVVILISPLLGWIRPAIAFESFLAAHEWAKKRVLDTELKYQVQPYELIREKQ